MRLLLQCLAMGVGSAFVVGGFAPQVLTALRRLGWTRPNYEGVAIPNSAGLQPAAVLVGAGLLLAIRHGRLALVAAVTVALFALLGWLDDRFGARDVGGFRGHVGALLREHRLTTGLLKLAAGGLVALGAAWWLAPGRPSELLARALLIALAANALNLLDLRPLRALKVYWLAVLLEMIAAGMAGRPVEVRLLAPALGASVGWAPFEARREGMLGDTGANALGAFAGLMAGEVLSPGGRWIVVAALILFHGVTERVSLSAVIERQPALRWLDGLGRG